MMMMSSDMRSVPDLVNRLRCQSPEKVAI